MTGGKGCASVVVGVVGMWVTGCLMELWETLFAGRGKAALAFPCAVNGVFHSGIACYPHFHDAVLRRCVLRQVCRVDFVVIKYFVRLDDCRAAAQVPFHVKGVFLVKVGKILVLRVLRYVVLIAEKRAHTAYL